MNAVRIIMLCVAAAALCATLRVERPEMALGVTMAAGTVALMLSIPDLRTTVAAISDISQKAGVLNASTQLMLRAAGIALLAEFGAQLCRDAGEGTLAARIEFGGRIAILAFSVPLLSELLSKLTGLLQ